MPAQRTLVALASVALLAACEREPAVPGRVEHVGSHVTIVAPGHVPVNASALAYVDALVGVASRSLDLGRSSQRVLVFPRQSSATSRDDCPIPRDYRRRCVAPNRAAVVTDVLDDNNIIRGVLWRAHRGHEAFASALALALGDPSGDAALWDGGWTELADPEAAPRLSEWPLFLQWLVRERGVDRVLRWYRSTSPAERTEEVLASFDVAIGQSFRSELARFRSRAPTALHWGAWSIAAMCTGADTLTLGARVAAFDPDPYSTRGHGELEGYSVSLGGDEHWIATRPSVSESVQRFTVREPRPLIVTAVHSDGRTDDPQSDTARIAAKYAVVSCDRSEVESGGETQQDLFVQVPPGRYALRTVLSDARRNVEVRVSQQSAVTTTPSARTDTRSHAWARSSFAWGGLEPSSLEGPRAEAIEVPLDAAPVPPMMFVDPDQERSLTMLTRTDRWTAGADGRRYLVLVAYPFYSWARRTELRVDQWNAAWGPLTARLCLDRGGRRVCSEEPITERPVVLNGLVILSAPAVSTPIVLSLTNGQFQLYGLMD